MIIGEALSLLISQLQPIVGTAIAARQEALWMLMAVTGKSGAQLLSQQACDELNNAQYHRLLDMMTQRVQGKPLQYLLGTVPFADLTLKVREPIFIPRPETEEIVEWITHELALYKNMPLRILDLCTGSGTMALALASYFSQAQVVGVDINPDAIDLARENAVANKLDQRVQFLVSDLFTQLLPEDRFDLIVSNPPYLAQEEWEELADTSIRFEDTRAFVASDQGMQVYRRLLTDAPRYLSGSSILAQQNQIRFVGEIGPAQHAIQEMAVLCNHNWHVRVYTDLQGFARWIAAKFDKNADPSSLDIPGL